MTRVITTITIFDKYLCLQIIEHILFIMSINFIRFYDSFMCFCALSCIQGYRGSIRRKEVNIGYECSF